MIILKSKVELQKFLRNNSHNYAFVPTMGNLHPGHLSLIQTAKKYSKHVIVSIFVNPTQFGVNEDFTTYPRTLEQDISMLESQAVDTVYVPTLECLYPVESKLWLDIPHLTKVLCGRSRPHFFNGVMTVLLKFCLQISPKFIILGEKDYQQFLVVKEMVMSAGFDTKVIPSPIIRNQSGLALSSRNSYLKETHNAEKINKILFKAAQDIIDTQNVSFILEEVKKELLFFIDDIDYLELRSNFNLEEYSGSKNIKDFRLFFAGKLEKIRLIDNICLSEIHS
jgi:pantoate--beta-alanine ligase